MIKLFKLSPSARLSLDVLLNILQLKINQNDCWAVAMKLKATEHVFQSKANNIWSKLGQICLMTLSWGAKTLTYDTVHN